MADSTSADWHCAEYPRKKVLYGWKIEKFHELLQEMRPPDFDWNSTSWYRPLKNSGSHPPFVRHHYIESSPFSIQDDGDRKWCLRLYACSKPNKTSTELQVYLILLSGTEASVDFRLSVDINGKDRNFKRCIMDQHDYFETRQDMRLASKSYFYLELLYNYSRPFDILVNGCLQLRCEVIIISGSTNDRPNELGAAESLPLMLAELRKANDLAAASNTNTERVAEMCRQNLPELRERNDLIRAAKGTILKAAEEAAEKFTLNLAEMKEANDLARACNVEIEKTLGVILTELRNMNIENAAGPLGLFLDEMQASNIKTQKTAETLSLILTEMQACKTRDAETLSQILAEILEAKRQG